MSVHGTKHGTWEVRWRALDGRQHGRTFKTRALAEGFDAEVRARTADGQDVIPKPLWQKMLEAQLGDRAAVDVPGFNPNGHFVYLLWGMAEDRPIYVGRSSNVLARLGNHLSNPERRYLVSRVTLVRCYSQADAAETEAALIDLYCPDLNVLDGNGTVPKR